METVQPEKSKLRRIVGFFFGKPKNGVRYRVLDIIRAVALLNMIAYHTLWDMANMFGFEWEWFDSTAVYAWQQTICSTFIFLSGFCQPLGRRTPKRGLLVLAGGIIITVTTLIAIPDNVVWFSVLTFLGLAMLIATALDPWLKKLPPTAFAIVFFVLFLLTNQMRFGYIGLFGIEFVKLPRVLFANYFTAFLGFPPKGFRSADYFSLFPWLFLFLSGYFLNRLLAKKELMHYLEFGNCPPLEWLGRHTLPIYLVHQPLIYLVLSLIF